MREQIRSGVLPRRVRTGCRRSLWLAAPVQRDPRVMVLHSKRCVPALSRDEQHRWWSRSPVGRSVRAYTALTPYLRRVRHLRAAVSVCGAVSRIAKVAPFSSASFRICDNRSECVEMTAGVSPSRLSLHFAAEDCGSKSIKAVVCPARSAATDKCVARVVLPVPPFLLKIASFHLFNLPCG